LKVTIPANTSATVYLPALQGALVTEGGNPVETEQQDGSYIVQVGSGSYDFEVSTGTARASTGANL
jgi:alpha-L-rhamnosidase